MARRSDHTREELRELILSTASNIVKKEGHQNLSARRLANEIGYAAGTIYNLFHSMEDLIMYINARTIDALYDVLSADQNTFKDHPPRDNMKKMALAYIGFARENNAHWFMLFNSKLPASAEIEWYKQKIDKLFQPLEIILEPYFADQNERNMTARMLWSSIHGICYLQETGVTPLLDQNKKPETMSYALIDRFMDGLEKGD